MKYAKILPLALLTMAFASCSQEAEPEVTNDDVQAKGEILGGTISDDMLPLDSRTSQSPQLADAPEPAEVTEPEAVTPEPNTVILEAAPAMEQPAVPALPQDPGAAN